MLFQEKKNILFVFLLGATNIQKKRKFDFLSCAGLCLIFYFLRDAQSVRNELGQAFVVCLFTLTSIKTGTRRIIRLDELSKEVRLPRRPKGDSSSRRIIGLRPVFIRSKQTHDRWLTKFVPDGLCVSSIKNDHSAQLSRDIFCIQLTVGLRLREHGQFS